MQFYSSSHALVIGIDDYTNGWPRLSNAIVDATKVAEALRNKGFDVTQVSDLNGQELESALEDFFIDKGADPESRLFIWYAGHGHTVNGEGYLIPSDGVLETDRGNFLRRSISLRDFGKFSRLAQSKHVYTIFDSCFAGTIFNVARSAPPPAITRVTSEPVRQFLSSGDAGQTVSDDGTFATLFVEALNGQRRADLNADGYVTAGELGSFMTDKVSNYTSNKQIPRHGKLQDPAYDKGDFVFLTSLTQGNSQVISSTPDLNSPGAIGFNLNDLTDRANKETQVQADWNKWQDEMQIAFTEVRKLEDKGASTALSSQAWSRFVSAFNEDNPYSRSDDALREEARTRLNKLQTKQRAAKQQVASITNKPQTSISSAFLDRKLRFRSRIFLVAGGKSYQQGSSNQHSPFSKQYLTALRSGGGSDNILTKAELKSYMEVLPTNPRMGDFGSYEPGSDFLHISGGNPKGRDHALVIGIGDYREWRDLANPVADAKAVARELRESYRFDVDLLLNPTKKQIFAKMLALRNRQFGPDDQLLIYVAGHGFVNSQYNMAYLIPADGKKKDILGTSYFRYSNLRDAIDSIKSEHTMVVIDAVMGGTFE